MRKRIGSALEEGCQQGRDRTLNAIKQLENDTPAPREKLSHMVDSLNGPV